MPNVTVRFGHGVVLFREDHEKAQAFGGLLQEVVARNLACHDPGGDLVPSDVDVSFATAGMYDLQSKHVMVTILASHYESRAENAEERIQAIALEVREWLRLPIATTIGFWLLMPQAVYADSIET